MVHIGEIDKKRIRIWTMDFEWIDANKLLSCERIDLMAKYTFVEHRDKNYNMEWADELYMRHIEAFSGGNFSEPGNKNKTSMEAYRNTFYQLCDVMKNDTFDSSISSVPCNNDNVIGDGAHRVSAGAYYGRVLPCRIQNRIMPVYDYAFFLEHYLEPIYCDYMLTKYVEMKSNNIYVICIWPKGMEKREILPRIKEKILQTCKIVGYKEVGLSYLGLKNFMIQCYANQSWMSGVEKHFQGVEGKVDSCYSEKGLLGVYVVELLDNTKDSIYKIKAELRELFGMQNHSVHSSDTIEEAVRMVHLLFNQNSVYLLNYAKLDYDVDSYYRIKNLREYILQEKNSIEEYMIDSSTVMAIFGIRKSRDLDYITLNDKMNSISRDDIDCHNSYLKYYNMDASQLVMNPKNYGYVFDMKIITLPILMRFKENRGEKKDLEDVKLIKNLIDSTHSLKEQLYVSKIRFGRFLRNVRTKIRDFLQKHNIYFFTKLWHLLRGKGFKL